MTVALLLLAGGSLLMLVCLVPLVGLPTGPVFSAVSATAASADALGTKDTEPEPGGEEDGHSEKAS